LIHGEWPNDMIKFLLFPILWLITGNFFISLLIVLILFYWMDRRFIGMLPNIFKPWQRLRKLRKLRYELALNPHDISSKLETARLLIERKHYNEAREILLGIAAVMDNSSEFFFDLGLCHLKLEDYKEGERLMLRALEINPRVRYGEPYLRLGEAFVQADKEKAIAYLEEFKTIHSSSCEAYFRLGQLYEELGRKQDSKDAYLEAANIYRSLPKYKRKSERRWALLAGMKRMGS
jgi:tetratricopeptide (TPR) repeat protein